MTLPGYLVAAGAGLALVAGAFMTGRWTVPEASEAPLAVQLPPLLITRVVYRTRAVQRHTVAVVQPDGSSTTTTDEHEAETEATSETPPPVSEVVPLLAAATTRALPQWRVGAGVGIGLTNNYQSVTVLYQAELDRRLLGPVWVGLRVNTMPSVALTLSVEF